MVLSFAEPDDGGTGSDWIVGRFGEILQERVALRGPEFFPGMLGVDPLFAADGEFVRIARRGGIVRAIDVRAQRRAASGVAQNSFHLRSARS